MQISPKSPPAATTVRLLHTYKAAEGHWTAEAGGAKKSEAGGGGLSAEGQEGLLGSFTHPRPLPLPPNFLIFRVQLGFLDARTTGIP